VKHPRHPPHWWQFGLPQWQLYGVKRRGISQIGYALPTGGAEWNPARWPPSFVLRAIATLKAARPLR
jgi:hypothetical protein